ncbi:ABC transporter substrate-binding protein [Kitasatospora sp. NPDC057015]|uniref:ABC transporter substrate-binding protein n=1 Tax=Kitasatospora sp. NPDC057015 TaxID=3346001 RepID=UPI003633C834
MTGSVSARLLPLAVSLSLLAGTAACGAADTGSTPPTSLSFWGWAPGYEEAVARFNATHRDIRVNYEKIAPGSQGGYDRILAAAKAGTAPCLAQIGYESVASFAVEGVLRPLGQDILGLRVYYNDDAWWQAGVGGEIYGIPVDVAPMALFYRTDVFARYGLRPEATWEGLATDAAGLQKAAPAVRFTAFTPDDPWWFTGLAAQAGGSWFDVKAKAWKINVDEPGTTAVTRYWQTLIDKGQAKVEPGFSDEFFRDLENGTIAALPEPAWFASLLEQKAPGAAGKWAIAPLPRWASGGASSSFVGGSATSVTAGCPAPHQAVEFAHWLSSDRGSLEILVDRAGLFPAAVTADSVPALRRPSPYFGDQVVAEAFRSQQMPVNWIWGPAMNETSKALSKEFTQALAGHTPLRSALERVEAQAAAAMRAKGIDTTGG